MTKRQDHVDALQRYQELHDQYTAALHTIEESRLLVGLGNAPDLEEMGRLGRGVEEARLDHFAKFCAWLESGEG
jgi:hypothetical protein